MKKKKKKREQRKRWDLSCPRRDREREREIGRTEGREHGESATELADLTPARDDGSGRGRLAATEGGWVSTFRL